MKKTFFIALILVSLLLFAGSHSIIQRGPSTGDTAPAIATVEADSIVRQALAGGNYVLLNFWNSSDAESRRVANGYRAWKRRFPNAHLRIIGINFDKSPTLFHEIVRLDSLEPSSQYHASGDTARAIINSYGLDGGYGAVLIAPDGKIIATNPSETDLDAIFALQPGIQSTFFQ